MTTWLTGVCNETSCYALGAFLEKNTFMRCVMLAKCRQRQNTRGYFWKEGSKVNAASLNGEKLVSTEVVRNLATISNTDYKQRILRFTWLAKVLRSFKSLRVASSAKTNPSSLGPAAPLRGKRGASHCAQVVGRESSCVDLLRQYWSSVLHLFSSCRGSREALLGGQYTEALKAEVFKEFHIQLNSSSL